MLKLCIKTTNYVCIGVLFLCAFIFMRFLPHTGSLRGHPFQVDRQGVSGVMSFFSVCKYPPSLAFACLTLGIDFLLLHWFSSSKWEDAQAGPAHVWVPKHLYKVLHTFGTVPLFFYLVHFWSYGLLSGFFHLVSDWDARMRLEGVFLVWLCMMVFCFQVCQVYGKFKAGKPKSSWWRLL